MKRTIELLSDMQSCITQGQKPIKAGTIMHEYYSQLSWVYFKDAAGNTMIIMGFASPDWDKVKTINQ